MNLIINLSLSTSLLKKKNKLQKCNNYFQQCKFRGLGLGQTPLNRKFPTPSIYGWNERGSCILTQTVWLCSGGGDKLFASVSVLAQETASLSFSQVSPISQRSIIVAASPHNRQRMMTPWAGQIWGCTEPQAPRSIWASQWGTSPVAQFQFQKLNTILLFCF